MLSRQCPFCENVNPPSSKFCNACGVKLHAALCPHCGAVNVLTATTCVSCAVALPDASGDTRAASPATPSFDRPAHALPSIEQVPGDIEHRDGPLPVPALETVPPLAFSVHFDRDHAVKIDRSYDSGMHLNPYAAGLSARRTSERQVLASTHVPLQVLAAPPNNHVAHPLTPAHDPRSVRALVPDAARSRRYVTLFGVAVVALLAGSAYYLHHAHTLAEMSALIATSRELKGPDRSIEGAVGTETPSASASTDTPAVTPIAPPPATPALPAIAPGPQPISPNDEQRKVHAGTGQIGSAEAAAAVAAAAAREKKGKAPTETPAQGFGPCTDAIAALGLCTRESPTRQRQ
jgi:hypothetical protein